MDQTTRKSLTQSLSKLTVEIAAALRVPMRTPGPVQEAAQALHREEQVGEAFDLWTDLLSRRASVLWVLKSLYLRILEDRGLLQPRRILDAEDELFRHLAPNLGPTAYLRWVFRDLASARGGLPELFAPQPAELAVVPDALSQRLIDFWRSKNPDTGELLYRFDDEHFDSRLMGDLYQDLDPVVKKRYALLQTPDFVLDFILDETLTPAIAEWGVENVRVLDPACGSGHFLLAAFKRLVAGMRSKHPARPVREIVEDVLSRVVGIDLNDYACGLARARLVMTALETCRETDLAAAGTFHPRVFWADALEQVEEDEQLGLATIADDHRSAMALLTPPEVRAALRPELKKRFHVVVGNPPFDNEKDPRRREYHRSRGKSGPRYRAAAGKYSLSAPFIERAFQIASPNGWVGLITANSFMKNEFGKAVIERVLRTLDIREVVDSSGVLIPGAAIPTVILICRNRRPAAKDVLVTMGKKREPRPPEDPAKGMVWMSIALHHRAVGYDGEFISVTRVERDVLSEHPWRIGGGGAAELSAKLQEAPNVLLGEIVESIGINCFTLADEVYVRAARDWPRAGVATPSLQPMLGGETIRDWAARCDELAFFPYNEDFSPADPATPSLWRVWHYRTELANGLLFGGTTKVEGGLRWYEYGRLTPSKLASPLSIVVAEVASHNHAVLVREPTLCKQSAIVVKLDANASLDDHLLLLAQLNSSVAAFFLRQVCRDMGGGGNGRGISDEPWEVRLRLNSGKLEMVPLARPKTDARLQMFAQALDEVARERFLDAVARTIADAAPRGASALRVALETRRARDLDRLFRLVGLQEELDWLCYEFYRIDPSPDARDPNQVSPISPGWRPFEIALARREAESCSAVSRGEEPDEAPTAWFTRHGWNAETSIEAIPEAEQAIMSARLERTQANRELALLEQPTYKRRWYKPDCEREERQAMELWLDDRLEAWAKERAAPFTAAQASAALRSDAGVLAVGELLSRRSDFDVDVLIAERVRLAAVPNMKHHVFKAEGLLKRAEWEKTWEQQHREDFGESVKPDVPPKYSKEDFLKKEYWDLRGKLDVPKERFIAFTEVPPPTGAETLYAWAGWTPRERAKAMLGLDEQLEAAGVNVADRHGLLYGVWFLLPYVAWESADAARDFRADVRSLVGENGVTEAMLDEWAKRFPPPKGGKPAKPKPSPSAAPKAKKGARAKAKAKAKEDAAT